MSPEDLAAAPEEERASMLAAWLPPGADELCDAVWRDLGVPLHSNELAGTTREEVCARLLHELGLGATPPAPRRAEWAWGSPLDGPRPEGRNAPAVFLLGTPRSGTTLLRVMLAGHSRLFSPPELMLLPFATMGRRRDLLEGHGYGWARLGLVQALEGLGLDPALVEGWEGRDASTAEVFRSLQEAAAPRLLLDKTPANLASLDFLQYAEELFDSPRYLHLVRHPAAVVESFLRMRVQGLLGPWFGVWDEDPALFAAEIWARWNENALRFAERLPPGRFHRLRYEDLVQSPRQTMEEVCRFLGLDFEADVLEPYRGDRMTVDAGGRPALGDWNLGAHAAIDPGQADKWKGTAPVRLGERARRVAAVLGYGE